MIQEIEQAMRHNLETKKMKLFANNFEFLFATNSLHEDVLRHTISLYLNDLIKMRKIIVQDKYETMNKYLKLIEDTPMFMQSAFRQEDKEKGHYFENNKIILPNV